MKNETEKSCPLCGVLAAYIDADSFNRKTYKCPNCSSFQISNDAEDRLEKAIQNWRDTLVEKAKMTTADNILVITLPLHSDKANRKNLELVASYVHNSEVPN